MAIAMTVAQKETLAQHLGAHIAPCLRFAIDQDDADLIRDIIHGLTVQEKDALIVVLGQHWPVITVRPEDGVVDEIAVRRAAAGEQLPLTRVERDLAIHLMGRRGTGLRAIATHLNISPKTVKRVLSDPLPVQTALFDAPLNPEAT